MGMLKDLFTRLLGRKIYYIHKDGKSLTPCPWGGAVEDSEMWGKGRLWPGAKVGSPACNSCLFSIPDKLDHHSVRCRRTKK